MSSIGAVIVTWNSGPLVEAVVEALLCGDRHPERVVVVDNGSTDDASLATLDALPPDVQVHRAGANLGFCAGNNLGLSLLGEVEHVLLLNPDAVVTTGFLAGASAVLDRDLDLGAVGPKLLALDRATGRPTGHIDSAGIVQTWYGRFVDRGQGEPDDGRFDHPDERADALCAAALLLRRRALTDVDLGTGPFDERFFAHKEDVDLCLRLRRAGWRLAYRPDLVVHHARGTRGADWADAPLEARRRSLRNEWHVWRRGTLSLPRRTTMLPYLLAKSALTAVAR